MKKRRERALHLFQLTGRESAVNRLHVDKVRQGIVQKMVRAPWWCPAKSRSETETGMTKRKRRRRFDKGVSTRPGLAAASPSSKDSPRDVALREQAEAFALQDRRGAFRIIDVHGEGGATIGAGQERITEMHIHFRHQQCGQNFD